jgi:SAM-dependent methyltransferase
MARDSRHSPSALFWDRAARDNAAWYVATSHVQADPAFFARGAQETDELLAFCGIAVEPADTVLEIGAGIGRMTHRLAELGGQVIATDVSAEMLARARTNLHGHDNVALVVVPGDGALPVGAGTVDVVFSYIVLQHVATVAAQVRYLNEAIRAMRPGGRLAVQVRASGPDTLAHEWAGYLGHRVRGRRTMDKAWRGTRVPARRLIGLTRPDVTIELKRSSRRHLWVVARRDCTDRSQGPGRR